MIPNTPLFVKTHDFVIWLIRHTQRFPISLRQSYTLRLENTAFDFQESVLVGNSARGPARSRWLERADGQLVCLRALLKFAYDLELLAGTQVKHAAELVDELGRLLGALRKGTDRYTLALCVFCVAAGSTILLLTCVPRGGLRGHSGKVVGEFLSPPFFAYYQKPLLVNGLLGLLLGTLGTFQKPMTIGVIWMKHW